MSLVRSRTILGRFLIVQILVGLGLYLALVCVALRMWAHGADRFRLGVYRLMAICLARMPGAEPRDCDPVPGNPPYSAANFWISDGTRVLASYPPRTPFPGIKISSWPRETFEVATLDGGDFFHAAGVVKLPGDRYLIGRDKKFVFRGDVLGRTLHLVFLLHLGGSIFLSGLVILLFFRSREKTALRVLSSLRNGDLKARFPIHASDELTKLMRHFNGMADEIERLVESLRRSEQGRTRFLREVSHDLRTPIAAALSSIDYLEMSTMDKLSEEGRKTLQVSRAELEYLSRTLEQLFRLAQLPIAQDTGQRERLELVDLVRREVELRAAFGKIQQSPLLWTWQSNEIRDAWVEGDRWLILRLFKNALDNAARYGRSRITVRLEVKSRSALRLIVHNDGNSISEQSRESFGRSPKPVSPSEPLDPHVSMGLGSTVIRRIAEKYGWPFEISNHPVEGVQLAFEISAELTLRTDADAA